MCVQSPTLHKYFGATHFFPLNHLKANVHSPSEHPINSRSNMYKNLVHSSTAPKKAILPTFSGHTQHFLCKNHKTITKDLLHQKFVYIALFSLWVGPVYTKGGAIILSMHWQSHLYHLTTNTTAHFYNMCLTRNCLSKTKL